MCFADFVDYFSNPDCKHPCPSYLRNSSDSAAWKCYGWSYGCESWFISRQDSLWYVTQPIWTCHKIYKTQDARLSFSLPLLLDSFPGRSRKAAEQKWKEMFADKTVHRDQVEGVNDDGISIGKAGRDQGEWVLVFSVQDYLFEVVDFNMFSWTNPV